MQIICRLRSKHCRSEAYGEQTDHREDVSVSSYSVILISLGEPSCLAEIELILATTTLLGKLNFKGFQGSYQ